MEEQEKKKTRVGLDEKGRWGWGHQQGRGKRGQRRLKSKSLSEQMAQDEQRLRKRCFKD